MIGRAVARPRSPDGRRLALASRLGGRVVWNVRAAFLGSGWLVAPELRASAAA